MSGLAFLREQGEVLQRKSGGGHENLQSWVTLKRNLQEPFPAILDADKRCELRSRLFDLLGGQESLAEGVFIELESLERYERIYLYERRLIGTDSLVNPLGRGLALSQDGHLAVLVGEEDHLRIQCHRPGLAMEDAFLCADNFDASLEQHCRYAFSEVFGYLTACPSEAGTGLRTSALLHMPALALQGELPKIIRGLLALKLAIRGTLGDTQGAPGAWLLLSNSRSLGQPEQDYVESLDRAVRKLLNFEDKALERALLEARSLLEDEVGKALKAVEEAEELTSLQAVALLGTLRLGSRAGLLPTLDSSRLGPLEAGVMPGHLQVMEGKPLEDPERRSRRAETLKSWLFT